MNRNYNLLGLGNMMLKPPHSYHDWRNFFCEASTTKSKKNMWVREVKCMLACDLPEFGPWHHIWFSELFQSGSWATIILNITGCDPLPPQKEGCEFGPISKERKKILGAETGPILLRQHPLHRQPLPTNNNNFSGYARHYANIFYLLSLQVLCWMHIIISRLQIGNLWFCKVKQFIQDHTS